LWNRVPHSYSQCERSFLQCCYMYTYVKHGFRAVLLLLLLRLLAVVLVALLGVRLTLTARMPLHL